MSSKYKLKQSRDGWKEKSIKRGNSERYQRKETIRARKERDKYKREAREAKMELEKELKKKKISPPIQNKEDLVFIALQLFLVARIGFRATSRVLGILRSHLGLTKAPCTQTIINWVIRLSITRIRCPRQLVGSKIDFSPFSNGLIWIIDASIGLGSGKILAILALDVNHHVLNKGAPTLAQVSSIAVSVAASWTGETIANFLQKIIACTGKPAAYLKDGGTDLAKAIKILGERGCSSLSIDDISHKIANLLKHKYQNHPMFATFISACGKVSKKFKQTVLACLVPPKVSTKARFMNLHRMVKWADQLLEHAPKGSVPKNSLLSKLRASLAHITECRTFISDFLRDANPLLECQNILKTKGLSQESYRQCQQLIKTIPSQSSVHIGFKNWAEEQLKTASNIGLDNAGMPISSDNIESLFGISKQHGTGEIKDANRIALRIPALCGELTREDAQRVLKVTVKKQQKIVGTLPSVVKQRRQILPNPACFDKIQPENGAGENLELIPEFINRSKNITTTTISDGYDKANDPSIVLEKQARPPPEVKFPAIVAA